MRLNGMIGVVFVLSAGGVAMAQQEEVTQGVPLHITYGASDWVADGGERATTAYSCVNLASTSFTRNFNVNTPGTTWLMGDDMQLLNLAGGSIVDELTFSAVNGASASAAGGGVVINVAANAILADIFVWDLLGTDFSPTPPSFETRTLLGSFNVALPALNSLFGTTLTVTGLSAFNINVGSGNVWVAARFRDNPAVAGDQTAAAFRYGQLVSNINPTVGAGANAFFREQINGVNGDAVLLAFAPPTISNFNYAIATVPTPGAIVLFGASGLVALRRRR